LFEILRRLAPAIVKLNRTEDFISLVMTYEPTQEDIERLLRATVPQPLFEKLFFDIQARKD
jgi:hypothetical protein